MTGSSRIQQESRESVIGRVSRILAAFDRQNSALGLSVLAERADLPVATTYRLATELVRHGLLERGEDKRIRVGMRLWELSTRGNDRLAVRNVALPHLENLFESLGQLTTLGVLEGDTVLYLERLAPAGLDVERAHIGQRHPIHAGSTGLVLLAFSPGDYQEAFLRRKLSKFTPQTIVDPHVLRRHLAMIRRQRYVMVPGVGMPDWTGIAVPIFDGDKSAVAALSVVYPRGKEDPAALPAMRAAAFAISMTLSSRPHPDED
ncbi:IclR family transcriptional regulator [Nocardia miyunensis]|uniref:IclR family transcriptional regulator n=1 Tax=Nocardia miyunensis TaxID=282684 RepID=UPI00082E1F7A|nr:IclR family transcriptional regulator [Nocardia miyunensis]